MSAYFTNMESKCTRAGEDPRRVAEDALNRMGRYLQFLRGRVKSDQLLKLDGFGTVLTDINRQWYGRETSAVSHIRDLHTLAHDIGHGRVALRSGGFATDNPYFGDQFSSED